MAEKERWVAAVLFPRLALELLGGLPPPHAETQPTDTTEAWRDTVVVVDDSHSKGRPFALRNVTRIADATCDLRALRVVPPMRVMDAQQISPSLHVVVQDERVVDEHLLFLAELCLQLTPVVQPGSNATHSHGALLLELTGLPGAAEVHVAAVHRLLLSLGHRCYVGCAHGPRRALAVARTLAQRSHPQGWYVASDVDIPRLHVDVLGLSDELAEKLRALGVRDVAHLRRLSSRGLTQRLHKEAKDTLDFLQLHDDEPLLGIQPPESIFEKVELDFAVSEVEPLLFLARPLVERVCARLAALRKRVSTLEVQFRLQRPHQTFVESNFVLQFPSPLHLPSDIVAAFLAHLSSKGIPVPDDEKEAHKSAHRQAVQDVMRDEELLAGLRPEVVALRFRVVHTADVVLTQQDAFTAGRLPPRALVGLLAELVAELGEEHVGCLRDVPHPLPEKMTTLCWSDSFVGQQVNDARAGPSTPQQRLDTLARNGRFLGGWPWPLHMLPQPVSLSSLAVHLEKVEPFALLEGEDEHFVPYRRDYAVLFTRDGRRALGAHDDEVGEWSVWGWFD